MEHLIKKTKTIDNHFKELDTQKKTPNTYLLNLIKEKPEQKNLDAHIYDIRHIKRLTMLAFIAYVKKMKYILESKKYKDRYSTADEFLKKEFNTAYSTIKEQIDIYDTFGLENLQAWILKKIAE